MAFSLMITLFMAVSRRLRDLSFSIVRGAHARTCDTLHIERACCEFSHSATASRRRLHRAAFDAASRTERKCGGTNRKARGPAAKNSLSPAGEQRGELYMLNATAI